MDNLKDKTVLVTGATDGVGRIVAQELGAAGARVLAHGRDRKRGEQTVAAIAATGGTAEFLQADLAELAQVRKLADAVKQKTKRLDILINNAGIGFGGGQREFSADGHELRFAVNYLSGFLLTHLLLPTIRASAPARIVNVSSAGQQAIDFADVMLAHNYEGIRAYRQSKLAQILFTVDLATELEGSGIVANCLHPSTFMDTTMVREAGIKPLNTAEDGAKAILNLAVGPTVAERSGLYFNVQSETRADAQAYDAEARARLKSLSLKLTGLPA